MSRISIISVSSAMLLSLAPVTMAFMSPRFASQRLVATTTTASPSWLIQYQRNLMVLAADTTATTAEAESTEEVASFPSTFSAPTVYDQIGITPEQLALGIEAEEVLQYIGTRQDLIDRFLKDLPKLDKNKVEAEVDKFLLDAEMLNSFISYEKARENDKEGMFGSSAENDFSFRNPKVIATYAAWIGGGIGFSYVRRNYIQPKFDSGEWEEVRFVLPNPMDLFKGGGGDAAVTDAAVTTTMSTTTHDAVVQAIDAVTTSTV